jgi:hypothetical protein
LNKTGKTVVKSSTKVSEVNVKHTFTSHIDKKNIFDIFVDTLEMPVPSQGHYGFPSFPVVD